MLRLLAKGGRKIKKANRYYGEKRAGMLIEAGLKELEVGLEELQAPRKGDWRKGLLAELIQDETSEEGLN